MIVFLASLIVCNLYCLESLRDLAVLRAFFDHLMHKQRINNMVFIAIQSNVGFIAQKSARIGTGRICANADDNDYIRWRRCLVQTRLCLHKPRASLKLRCKRCFYWMQLLATLLLLLPALQLRLLRMITCVVVLQVFSSYSHFCKTSILYNLEKCYLFSEASNRIKKLYRTYAARRES